MAIGKSVNRVDAIAKVTGRARYTDDFFRPDMLQAKFFRSTIAHGVVKSIDISKAVAVPGVEAVFTFDDVPQKLFATAGHPYSLDPNHQDIEDRLLLTQYIRYWGDEIAVVVAESELIANEALSLIEVEYETYEPLITAEQILAPDAREIHPGSKNCAGEHSFECGGKLEEAFASADEVFEGEYSTQMVQHCHIENHTAFAYLDDLQHIVIVSSTQIPHIVRRIVGQALDIPWGNVRVIKPYIGGGFGNKQDIVLEPLVAFLTTKLDGKPVKICMTREECMIGTRIRHPITTKVRIGINQEGTMVARNMDSLSFTGAYASHGHSIVAAAGSKSCLLYPRMAVGFHGKTIYSNIPAAGAMRAYGSPQINYAFESALDDLARKKGISPIEIRLKNLAQPGDLNPLSNQTISSCGVIECLEKGRELIQWDRKKAEWPSQQSGNERRGLGVACFSYGSGTYPVNVEIAGARLILNQDGSVHMQTGATEIGQGSDTIIAQMAAETTGLPFGKIHVVSTQDTDLTPYDPGAYASRQAFVMGNAVFAAATEFRQKIIEYAALITEIPFEALDISGNNIVKTENPEQMVISMEELALDSYYNKDRGGQITADVSHKTRSNAPSFGCTLVDLTIDIPMCQITINEIFNLHDSGVILNPVTAKGQVEGGMSMGIAAALTEQLLIDPKSGKILNNNLLDYKIPTIMDTPELQSAFVETNDPNSSYGNKSLGEPPIISPPPAIRNAVLDATGIAINELPITPQILFKHFKKHGLI